MPTISVLRSFARPQADGELKNAEHKGIILNILSYRPTTIY